MAKCEHCNNEAVYELDVSGKTVYVCESCDEDYHTCYVCGKEIVYLDTHCQNCNDTDDIEE